jgi:hypothetical protein
LSLSICVRIWTDCVSPEVCLHSIYSTVLMALASVCTVRVYTVSGQRLHGLHSTSTVYTVLMDLTVRMDPGTLPGMEPVTESAPSPAPSPAPYTTLAPAPALTQFFDLDCTVSKKSCVCTVYICILYCLSERFPQPTVGEFNTRGP